MEKEKTINNLNKYTSLGLCLLLFLLVLISYFVPIIIIGNSAITPKSLMVSTFVDEINFDGQKVLYISYYVSKFFYIAFASFSGILLLLTAYFFISNSKNFHSKTNTIMFLLVLMLFVSMLLGLNYINIFNTINDKIRISTYMPLIFIFGLIILALKLVSGIVFGKVAAKDELKNSNFSITFSFVLSSLALSAIFFPLYIFPGTKYRMTGFNILTGKEDILSFLPMSSAYKTILILLTISVAVSFIINIVFFQLKRKIFIQFNKVNTFIGFTALLIYALMGVNYMLVYIEAGAYSTFFNTSMNTYSFLPLALMLLFLAGTAFTKLTLEKLNIEYKVYTKPEETQEGIDTKAAAENSAVKPETVKPETNESDSKTEDEEIKKEKEEKTKKDAEEKAIREAEEKERKEKENIIPDPIPAFSELDKRAGEYNEGYERRLEYSFEELTLPKLVTHVIEYAKYSRERLSYGPTEVKTFIAGLAASRLSILQGMSGTGKTSLPKIFMESIDGFCEIVAVESSWRDKNELLGYYNEFNKKYTPKSFTQFLYKATLNKEIPYFIVLDEMNLSRIEYYFSDFLSLMEARENNRFIKLFDVQLFPHIDERVKYSALRDGHTIDIPTNVWFIGTANRDESTFEISDKVYDRAQTMNFDKRAAKVTVTEQIDYPKKFVPYSALRKLFDESKTIVFDAESYDAIKKVEQLLRPYKISFGNRVLKQIEEFVKAYVACSDINSDSDGEKFTHEAVDCIIFSKVVRKLELKQVTDIDTLIDEFSVLKLPKCEEFLHTLVDLT